MKVKNILQVSFFLLILIGCTPKTAEIVQTPEPPPKETTPEPDEKLSPCKNWLDEPNMEEIREWHVLYRDQMKEKNYEQAYQLWQKVYEIAPAADGKRNTHYGDGIILNEYFWTQETDSLKKDEYVKNVLRLYDEVIECYGKEGYVTGRKAFDLYYKYNGYASEFEMYQMFKKSIDLEGDKTQAFILNPFTALLTNLVLDEKIPYDEASHYANKMLEIIALNKEKKSPADWTKEGWDIVADFTPARLEAMEGIKGFYDCDYYKNKYYGSFDESKDSCENLISVLGRLRWGGCPLDDPELMAMAKIYKEKCVAPNPQCRDFLSEGDFTEAINCYEEKVEQTEDAERKAQFYLIISKIYYGELKRFSLSRKYALKALKHKPNWGDPYLLIGKLYASSGPLCGPGRGFDSQIVTWPAIDSWRKAKSVDPSVAKEANRLINRYSQFMPSKEDIFQRNLKVGDSFFVGCWIQRKTIIRTAD
jgi:tetratricopeptide (TPR) repeat protein